MGGTEPHLSANVVELLVESPSEFVELILVLHEDDSSPLPPGERHDIVVLQRELFHAWSDPVASYVRAVGGKVVDHAWINATLRIAVPPSSVWELAGHPRVRSVELATTL